MEKLSLPVGCEIRMFNMKVSSLFLVLSIMLFFFSGNVFSQGFGSFANEGKNASKQLKCNKPKISPASFGMGALYSCIQGREETVKWFINEIPNTNKVKNVKLMWNDWFKNIGFGIHSDKRNVKKSLEVISKLYAPSKRKELERIFFSNKNKTITTKEFILKYTYNRGPAIDERLIMVTER